MSSPDPPAADFATRRERSFADQSRTTGKKPPGPPLAQVSTDSGNLLFDRSIDLPDALGSGHTFCVSPHHGQLGMIGNVLGFVMDYACPVYDPFRPPRNWVAYIHLHWQSISVFGILLFAGLLYPMSSARTTYLSLARNHGVVWQGRTSTRAGAVPRPPDPAGPPAQVHPATARHPGGRLAARKCRRGDYHDVLALDEHHLTICRKIAKAFIVEWLWKAKAGARSFRYTSSSMKSQEEVGTESRLG